VGAGGGRGRSCPRSPPPRLAAVRGAAQLLGRPSSASHPADVVRTAGPVQAQEPRAARLAFRARSRSLTAADVDRARTEERSLLRAWVMRKTVHLIATEDVGWLLPLFADPIVRWSRKRLAHFGLARPAQDRALALLHREVDSHGPLTRPELAERLAAAGFDAAQEIKVHLWLLATLDGELCLGPDRGGQTCLVRSADWIGEQRRRPRDESLAELARRYIRAYGPAGDRDFARWAGLGLRDCRLGLERIAGELSEAKVGGETLLVARGRGRRRASAPTVRLLGAFDNYNLGYVSREFAVAPRDERRIVPGGGVVRPTITLDGRFVGTWSSKRSGKRLAVKLEPFAGLSAGVERALSAEVEDLGRFEGLSATL
jgi:Winged helix DNA-binding domain